MALPGRFYKMTGSGNDFIMLDGRQTTPEQWSPTRIRDVCDRRNGAGADGLVVLTPTGPDRVRMTFFNNDGSRAAMCGNAALCSTRLAARLGLAAPEGMILETDTGAFLTRSVGDGWLAELNLPSFASTVELPRLCAGPGEELVALGTVGVPHLVVLVPEVEEVDLMRRGAALRSHPDVGPEGANVNFVARPASRTLPWPIRTFERGVEGETLACGTGTVATAVALATAGLLDLPQEFLTRSGRILTVRATPGKGTWEDVWLSGEGRLVYAGEMEAPEV